MTILFELAEEEGEDYNLIDIITNMPEDVRYLFTKYLSKYINFPPRIIISFLAHDSEWQEIVRTVAREYVNKKLSGE